MTHETENKLFGYLNQDFNIQPLQSDMQQIENIIKGGEPSLIDLEAERWEWSQRTFPEATPLSSLFKAQEEIKEVILDIANGIVNVEEYADVIMCVLDSAERQGISPVDILHAFAAKNTKNKARTWSKNPDNSYSHVK